MTRRVVLICGPPGAGKTTYAHTLGLTVYDRDDPPYNGGWGQTDMAHAERLFRADTNALAHNPTARAAVIRSAPTRTARAVARAAIGATETVVIDTPLDTCIERIRGRKRPDKRTQVAAATSWWKRYEPEDSIDVGQRSREW